MRLWHIDLLPYLPNKQLVSQWRELNLIYRKRPKHILINYIYEYPDEYLLNYSIRVIEEMENRGIRIKSRENFHNYFTKNVNMFIVDECQFIEHNNEYLIICYYNLLEKYLRGQRDFDDERYLEMYKFIKSKVGME